MSLLVQQRSISRSSAVVAVVLLHAAMFYAISSGLDVTKITKPLESMVTVFVPEDRPIEPPPPMPQVKLPEAQLSDVTPPEPLPVQITPEVPVTTESSAAITTTTAAQEAIPTTTSFSIKSRVDPLYPAASRRSGEQGTVMLELIVGPDGKPSEVRVTRSSGYPGLDEAATTAVRKWRFAVNGGSGYSRLQLPVTFRLETAR